MQKGQSHNTIENMAQNATEEKFAPLAMKRYNASKVTTEGEDNQTNAPSEKRNKKSYFT